jgi:hypothetical protein
MSYDADAQAYFTAVETADGQTLETGVKDAIDAFVVGCKTDNIWTAIKAACIMAGARTLSGALVPLVGPAPTNVNFVSGDYNRETGLKGNGTNKGLSSNYPHDSAGQNDRSMAVYISQTYTTSAQRFVDNGTGVTTGGSHLRATTNTITTRIAATSLATVSQVPFVGFLGASRSSSSGYVRRVNGTNTTVTDVSNTPVAGNYTIFARGSLSNPSAEYCDGSLSWYSLGESLDLALLDSRLSTLMTALADPATYVSGIIRPIGFSGGYSRMLGGYRG